ncbi:hypothetical protein ACJMK2_029951, partial [Sinanodonta woodiana]
DLEMEHRCSLYKQCEVIEKTLYMPEDTSLQVENLIPCPAFDQEDKFDLALFDHLYGVGDKHQGLT